MNPPSDDKGNKSLDQISAEAQSAAPNKGQKRSDKPPHVPSNRVYVGNLPWSVSWQDLKDHFRQAGEPLYSTVFTDQNGRSKGCGIVEFATKEEADKAIATLNDSTIGNTGRLIFVREDREERAPTRGSPPTGERAARPPRAREPRRDAAAPAPAAGSPVGGAPAPASGESVKGRQVFVGNLPYHMSWQDLKDAFRPAGNVIRADVLMLPNGKSKGQGTVLFETKDEAQKAIEILDGTELQGRRITVHEDKFAV